MASLLIGTIAGPVSAQALLIPFKKTDPAQATLRFSKLRTASWQGKFKKGEKNKIKFALAEYYLQVNDLFDARQSLEEYLEDKSVDVSMLLANIFLYKIAENQKDEQRMVQLKKEIFNQKFILLFDNYKKVSYSSLSGNEYDVHYFVDRIEIFINGNAFETIRF